jgi:hypothetical protein
MFLNIMSDQNFASCLSEFLVNFVPHVTPMLQDPTAPGPAAGFKIDYCRETGKDQRYEKLQVSLVLPYICTHNTYI